LPRGLEIKTNYNGVTGNRIERVDRNKQECCSLSLFQYFLLDLIILIHIMGVEAAQIACLRGTTQGGLDDGAEIAAMKGTEVLELGSWMCISVFFIFCGSGELHPDLVLLRFSLGRKETKV